jgi:hypothetical protein
MKKTGSIFLILFILVLMIPGSCIEQFVPETDEDLELLVVEGLITDKPEENTIKLSRSLPLGRKKVVRPIKGAAVIITDDIGRSYTLSEKVTGTYITNPSKFVGEVGRKYRLNIDTKTQWISGNHLYESAMIEMKPVPPIDSVYWVKETISYSKIPGLSIEGCQIYLGTSDKTDQCRYYRWDYSETWEIRLPFSVPNNTCWVTEYSDWIDIKNTSALQTNKILDYPLLFISNETDRLHFKYSILVNQYSMSEDEFSYWEKLQNISQNVGSLYDIIPANVNSNVICSQEPGQKVLGYFCVSAKSSKRLFVDDYFMGKINFYTECIYDTIYGRGPIDGLGTYYWVIEDQSLSNPSFRVITDQKRCADCTTRGTKIEPSFWRDGKD